MTPWKIRDEQPGDEAAIAALTEAAFRNASHSDGNEAAIVGRLRADGDLALSLVLVNNDQAIIGRVDSRPHLKDIGCPTAVIAGRDDQIMPVEIVKELADGIPGARLTVVEDCGHMAVIEQPARVLQALIEWLERKTT